MPVPQIVHGTNPWLWVLVRKNVGWSGETRMRYGPMRSQGRVQRPHDVLVDLLQCLDFLRRVPFMRRFIGALRRGRKSSRLWASATIAYAPLAA